MVEIRRNPLAIRVSDELKLREIKHIYIPDLVDPNTDIFDWFYNKDMHLNNKGNKKIANLLKRSFNWEY